jgi:hypothetical protein
MLAVYFGGARAIVDFARACSFMKAGLAFARRLTTVSPTDAQEIASPEFGHGMDDVVRGRRATVSRIASSTASTPRCRTRVPTRPGRLAMTSAISPASAPASLRCKPRWAWRRRRTRRCSA